MSIRPEHAAKKELSTVTRNVDVIALNPSRPAQRLLYRPALQQVGVLLVCPFDYHVNSSEC